MENKKNKKKLFAIIGASALAFILTIALSVSITLAYFGGTKEGSATVTMDAAVTVDTATVTTTQVKKALPGQKIDFTGTATVACGENGAFLAAKIDTVAVDETTAKIEGVDLTNATFAGWKKHTDGYYYYTGAADENGTAPKAIEAGSQTLAGSFVLSGTALTNANANQAIKITVTFVAVQGVAFDTTGNPIANPTFDNVSAMVTEVTK